MFEYKVIAGTYAVDGSEVIVENPMGKGTLQRRLDHYGKEGFELVSSHYDSLNREIVLLLKKGGAVMVAAAPVAAAPAAAAAAAAVDDDDLPRRRAPADGKKRRRSKADLDRLYRD